MYRHILLAVDGSDHSVRATNEAIKLAVVGSDSVIDVLYVIDYDKAKQEVLHTPLKEELDAARRRKLAGIEERLRAHRLSYEVHILHGEPGPTIVEYADREQVDVVVIGSRGLNAFQEMMLGSVSHKVVKRAKVPVLVVK
ncbi:MAG: universal stress protein [Bacillus sp. (in: firmicutes)]